MPILAIVNNRVKDTVREYSKLTEKTVESLVNVLIFALSIIFNEARSILNHLAELISALYRH